MIDPDAADRRVTTNQTAISTADLWAAVRRTTAHALASGALLPIETETRSLHHNGIRFIVRVASNLRRKDAARSGEAEAERRTGVRPNPFLPYEPAMFVADLSPTHVCLLNKFNVLAHHLLIVTREYVDQETLISREDFAALSLCMAQIDAIALYNAGTDAGASQPHKHLQLVPLPLAEDGPAIPTGPALDAATDGRDTLATVPAFSFRHACIRLEPDLFRRPEIAAAAMWERYRRLLAVVGIGEIGDGTDRQSQAYNLLLTRRWMLLVPRTTERFAGVSVNALNFAGTMFVRNAEQLRSVEEAGPLAVLAAVGFPR